MQGLSQLRYRVVADILIACETSIVRLIRNSLKYVPRREFAHVDRDLKPIYTAIDAVRRGESSSASMRSGATGSWLSPRSGPTRRGGPRSQR
jgi:hypothetical protein